MHHGSDPVFGHVPATRVYWLAQRVCVLAGTTRCRSTTAKILFLGNARLQRPSTSQNVHVMCQQLFLCNPLSQALMQHNSASCTAVLCAPTTAMSVTAVGECVTAKSHNGERQVIAQESHIKAEIATRQEMQLKSGSRAWQTQISVASSLLLDLRFTHC